MIFNQQRDETRALFFSSWKKHQQQSILTSLEAQIVDVILAHPEYHSIFIDEESEMVRDYSPEQEEVNPYLHMGLHLAVREQLATNRPIGIKRVYRQLQEKYRNQLEVEHALMGVLAETLWNSQRHNIAPNDADYLRGCKELLK